MNEKNLREKVDNMTTTSFNIAGCPLKTFKRFMEFCEENAKITKIFHKDGKKEIKEELCYSIGLKVLLDIANADAKFTMLYEKIQAVEEMVIANQNQPTKEKSGTFGHVTKSKERVVRIKEPEVEEK